MANHNIKSVIKRGVLLLVSFLNTFLICNLAVYDSGILQTPVSGNQIDQCYNKDCVSGVTDLQNDEMFLPA